MMAGHGHHHDITEIMHAYRWMLIYICVVLTLGLILEILEASK